MKHLKYLYRYQKMQKLIFEEKTGTADEFAQQVFAGGVRSAMACEGSYSWF